VTAGPELAAVAVVVLEEEEEEAAAEAEAAEAVDLSWRSCYTPSTY
jgi:hypothetical protein